MTFFDADAAGQKAAERAAELLEPSGEGLAWSVNRTGAFEGGAFRLKAALLPPGHDPDTFLRTEGAAAFAACIGTARSLLGYALDRALTDPDGATSARARANAFARAALLLAKVADAEEAVALSREAAAKLGVDPTQLWIEAQRLQAALRRPTAPASKPGATGAGERAKDRVLVRLLLQHGLARTELLPLLEEHELSGEALRRIVAALRARPDASAESLLTDLDDGARSALTALLLEEDRRFPEDPVPSIADFRRYLEREQRLRRQRQIAKNISETQQQSGTVATPFEDFRVLHQESKVVYEMMGNVAQSLEHRDAPPPRSPDA